MDEWLTFLRQHGASIENDTVAHFGDPAAERQAAVETDVVMDLSSLALLEATGSDAESFLHGQFSNDIKSLATDRSTLAAYCNPKGRMFAVLHVFRTGGGILLQLSRTQADTVLKRLRMFVLRADVRLERVDERWVRLGVSGPRAEALVGAVTSAVPAEAHGVHEEDGMIILRLPGPWPRFELLVEPGRAPAVWSSLAATATPVGADRWAWLDIRAGLPNVVPAISEEFVPQMTNLDLLGGVSFSKGCYPGQEIVARMHYLGRLKQRMVAAHLAGQTVPQAGDKVYAASHGEQSAGTIVDARQGPNGGFDLLMVVQLGSLGQDAFHLGDLDGPVLEIGELPYSIEEPANAKA
jgi:folate-binding protein YgfZ